MSKSVVSPSPSPSKSPSINSDSVSVPMPSELIPEIVYSLLVLACVGVPLIEPLVVLNTNPNGKLEK